MVVGVGSEGTNLAGGSRQSAVVLGGLMLGVGDV